MQVNIERTSRSNQSVKPVDNRLIVASTHIQLEPQVQLTAGDLSLMTAHRRVSHKSNFVLDLVSYTVPAGKIRWRLLEPGPDVVLKRNGFIYADADFVLDRFRDNPDKGFHSYVQDFLRRYVGFLNGDIFVVKLIDDSGSLVSVSGECYGKKQANTVARELGGKREWFL